VSIKALPPSFGHLFLNIGYGSPRPAGGLLDVASLPVFPVLKNGYVSEPPCIPADEIRDTCQPARELRTVHLNMAVLTNDAGKKVKTLAVTGRCAPKLDVLLKLFAKKSIQFSRNQTTAQTKPIRF